MKELVSINDIDFAKGDGLIPVIVQDINTKNVLMLGYMNQEAFQKTQASGLVTFFSRSKNRLWTKGESSGNYLHLKEMHVDCDGDTLLIKANPDGPVCHKGPDTCFNQSNQVTLGFLEELGSIIKSRKIESSEKSYTASLLNGGINKMAQKVGEEAIELVIEAKDDNGDLFVNEASDLLFHYMVLLEAKGFGLEDVCRTLHGRHNIG